MYVLLFLSLFSIASTIQCGITDRIYERFVLGTDVMQEVRKTCEHKGDFDPLYEKIVREPLPITLRVIDSLFSESKESRLATMWRTTGEHLKEVFYAPIYYRTEAFAIWNNPHVQERLQVLYGDNAHHFNEAMRTLESLHNDITAKVSLPRSWWPVYRYQTFKDSDLELKVILQHTLDTLVQMRLLINTLNHDLQQSPFALFVPRLLDAIQQLGNNYMRLEQIEWSLIKHRYYVWRTELLTKAILRCTPPLIPLGKKP
jgi:hypothetical protein